MTIEHHPNFTAVYMYGQLAMMCLVGTKEQREAIPDEKWYQLATVASTFD